MSFPMVLTNLQNVAPGNIATLEVPVGPRSPTYDQVKLILSGGMTAAHIEWVRGKIDGRIFLDDLTGTDIQTRDLYRGIASEAAYVVLDFTEPKARNGAAEQLVASIPGHLCKSLVFEIKIAAGAPAGGRIRAQGMYRLPTNNPNIRKVFQATQAFPNAASDSSPNIIMLGNGDRGAKTKRIWIKESVAGVLTAVQIRTANNQVFEATRADIENDAKRNGLVPQAGWLVVDFISDGNLAGWLPLDLMTVTELRLVNSAAATFTLLHEVVDPIGRM